ncbi:hypothetical protein BsWGS_23185 [Bradybaena similaris]
MSQPFIFLVLFYSTCALSFLYSDVSGEEDKEEEDVETVIGIDLGTTYSCVGVYRYGRVEIIANDQGNRITPSYVAFTPDGDRLIGDAAKNQITSNPENTVFDVKRLIGRKWGETTVQQDIPFYPFRVFGKANKPHIQIKTSEGRKVFTPEEISAMVLGKMKTIAEEYLGKKIKKAVITVPAYFNFQQRQATFDAGTIAGLNVVRILNEPTAAAIAYGFDKREGQFHILVFDLGGGTFDVSILEINNGVFKVKATNGDTHLGGEDFDRRVVDYYVTLYSEKKDKHFKNNHRALQKLRREVEKGKRILSFAQQVRLEIDSFFGGEDFSELLTRAKFEELNMDLFKNTIAPVQQVLSDANLRPEDIHEVVLVGGSTRIPKIKQLVKEFFNGKEPSLDINPDEAVAYGAAINAAMLSGKLEAFDLILQDVTPLTLSTEVLGGIAHNMIPRNTPIPKTVSSVFTTAQDGQTAVKVAICEGERPLFEDNHFLGFFDLTGITPAPRGVPQIEITFEVDANGILKVTSVDKASGQSNEIVINSNENYLSVEDINEMIGNAEKYAEEDKKKLATAQARNQLESLVYSLRKMIKNEGSSLSQYKRQKLAETVDRVMSWLDADSGADADDYKERIEELQALLSGVKRVYKIKDEL